MADFNYNQEIEYIDGTLDLNFEAARKWAAEHGTIFKENESRRIKEDGKLKRYFIIGAEPQPYTPPTPPSPTQAEKEAQARFERNALLSSCDWTQLEDAPLTAETKAAWAAYRQALRDVPEQAGFPDAIEWPVFSAE